MEKIAKPDISKERISISNGFSYGMGGAGLQLCWFMINNYLTLFYTDVVGLTATTISAIMIIARVWDAVNDPMMGIIADRTQTRWGKFRPYLMVIPPFMAIFNILTFTVFPVEGIWKAILCLVTYVLAGMAYTALSIALNSIVNLITKDSNKRIKYVTLRSSAMGIVSIVLSAIAMPLILYFGQSSVATEKGFFWTTVLFSVLMLGCFWICAYKTREPQVQSNEIHREPQKLTIWESFKSVGQNKYLVLVIISTILGSIATIGRMSTLSYYVIYCMGTYQFIAPMYTIMSVTCLIGTMLIPTFVRQVGKRNLMILYNIIAIVCYLGIYFLPATNVMEILLLTAVIGLTNSQQYILFGLVSDCIDYGATHKGNCDVGIAMSTIGFSSKLASAIAGAGAVSLLSLVGYVGGQPQTPVTQSGINFIINILPAVCIGLSLLPLLMYDLEKKSE